MQLDLTMPVLVVDDYKLMARIVGKLLKQVGFHHVDEASDGEEAIGKMRERKYGLVVSDWNMAPVSGIDLLRQVRADPALCDVPFIMISAEVAPENVALAKSEGAGGYVFKPFDAKTLKSRIEAVFRG